MGSICSKPQESTSAQPAPQSSASAAAPPASSPTVSSDASASSPALEMTDVVPAASPSAAPVASPANKPRIAIVFYSLYGHITTMAKEIAKGIESAGGEASLFQVDETLSEEVLKLMHAPPKDASIPVISDPAALIEYDGILFGSGTRFGAITAQLKAFFDKSGQVWQKGGWVGKPVGIFFSTGTQGGGQETTALTTLTQFTHHGMIYVPIGYSTPGLFNMDEIHGGSAYGAGTFAGADGSRQPSKLELSVANHQGSYFTGVADALKRGRAAVAAAKAQ